MNELYQQTILAHNKNPRNFKLLSAPTHKAKGHNPLCGDQLEITLTLSKDNDLIEDIGFIGQGCAISKASSSLMSEAVKGKTREYALNLFEKFRALLLKSSTSVDKPIDEALGKLTVFSGIWEYPSRVKCAILPWHTLSSALQNEETASTENLY